MMFKTKLKVPLKVIEIHQTEAFQSRLQRKAPNIIDSKKSGRTTCVGRTHRDNQHEGTEYVRNMFQKE